MSTLRHLKQKDFENRYKLLTFLFRIGLISRSVVSLRGIEPTLISMSKLLHFSSFQAHIFKILYLPRILQLPVCPLEAVSFMRTSEVERLLNSVHN